MTRRAKIVSTIGPATESLENMIALVNAGMDVARLNRSHGSPEVHEAVYNNVREAAKVTGRNVAVLVDLQGPKIRLGKFENDEKHILSDGDIVKIDINVDLGSKQADGSILVGTTYKGLPGDVKVGDPLLIDDGKVKLEATAVDATSVTAKAVIAGPISNNKGINLPWAAVAVPALSEKDKEDLRWAVNIGADIIALSFVRSAADYEDALKIMQEEGRVVPVIAKVEKPQAVDNLEEVVKSFDGIMVARGDLGVEMPLEVVPLVQKECIELCRKYGKPVIVATQVLETMTNNPAPTRAEVSDCANAILDGADATMTSGETSVGDYPIITIETMAKISEYQTTNGLSRIPSIADCDSKCAKECAKDAAANCGNPKCNCDPCECDPCKCDDSCGCFTTRAKDIAVVDSAVQAAKRLGAKAIVTYTASGNSAQLASRLRPSMPIIALTPDEHVKAFLALSWGVCAKKIDKVSSTDEILSVTDKILKSCGCIKDGDIVIVLSGSPIGKAGSTNTYIVHTVGAEDNE